FYSTDDNRFQPDTGVKLQHNYPRYEALGFLQAEKQYVAAGLLSNKKQKDVAFFTFELDNMHPRKEWVISLPWKASVYEVVMEPRTGRLAWLLNREEPEKTRTSSVQNPRLV